MMAVKSENKILYPMVSLIVPMYLCEDFVVGLLDQLCTQDYPNTEIICVVDGSPDRALELVEEYSKRDDRIRILHQEHKGAGAARNLGITKAEGEYIVFPDVDDEYAPNYVSKLLSAIEISGADIAVCQYLTIDSQIQTKRKYCGHDYIFCPENKAIPTASIKGLLKCIRNLPHNKIFRKTLVLENDLQFSETMSLNDMFFCSAAVISSKSITFVNDHLFTYKKHRNPKSISTTRGNNPKDATTVCRQLYNWLRDSGKLEIYLDEFIAKETGSIHDYARYCRDDVFIENIVKEIVEEDPWRDMEDEELQSNLLLDCTLIKREYRKTQRTLNKTTDPEKREVLKMRIIFAEREIENCAEIKRRLQEDYGKKLNRRETVLSVRIGQVKKAGLIRSFRILYRKIMNFIV